MGFKFRKRIKVAPGVTINISKSGVSSSIGKPGATVNIGKNGVKGTVGIPGTGASYTKDLSGKGRGGKGEDNKPSMELDEGYVMPWVEFCKLPVLTRQKYLEEGGKVGKIPTFVKVLICFSAFILFFCFLIYW